MSTVCFFQNRNIRCAHITISRVEYNTVISRLITVTITLLYAETSHTGSRGLPFFETDAEIGEGGLICALLEWACRTGLASIVGMEGWKWSVRGVGGKFGRGEGT